MTHSAKLDVVGVGLNATDTLIPVATIPRVGPKSNFVPRKCCPAARSLPP